MCRNLVPLFSLYAIIDLIRFTASHIQPCVSKFVISGKDDMANFLAEQATQCLVITYDQI